MTVLLTVGVVQGTTLSALLEPLGEPDGWMLPCMQVMVTPLPELEL